MRQGLTLIGEQKHKVAGLGLRLCAARASNRHDRWHRDPDAPSACAVAGASGNPSTLDSCDREIVTQGNWVNLITRR